AGAIAGADIAPRRGIHRRDIRLESTFPGRARADVKIKRPNQSKPTNGPLIAGAGMTAVDSMVILYLALPVALFFFTWFRPVFGIPFGLAALAGVVTLLPLPDAKQCWRVIGLSLVVAVLWGALSGASHFFYAGNETNWPIRDAVYRDLIVTPG